MNDAAPRPPGDDIDLAAIEAALAGDAPATAADGTGHATTEPHAHVEQPGPSWQDFVGSWDLFQDAVVAGAIAGIVLGFLSVYIVLRRMVFFSAAVTQSAGLGVALSFFVSIYLGWSISPSLGAIVLSLGAAAVLTRDWQKLGISREMMLGLLFALASGAAVLVGAKITQEAHDITAILFGTAVVVAHEDLHGLEIAGAAVMLLQLWWFRGFVFASFDPVAARVQRVPVALLDLIMAISIAVVIAQSARAIGAMPTFALSTLPGMAAVVLARGPFFVTFVVASLLGAVAGVGGYLIAFLYEFPVGATQAVLAGALVVVAVLLRTVLAAFTTRWHRTRVAA
ncbi:MAG: metal ABC transporter permease [Myxococcales bacterium]|nr:metal ABC transporter permease [Myxococcales bacterium]